MKVKNQYGKEINFSSAVQLMDAELREKLHGEIAPCSEQEFFDRYCKLHRKFFGKEFELNNLNPQY